MPKDRRVPRSAWKARIPLRILLVRESVTHALHPGEDCRIELLHQWNLRRIVHQVLQLLGIRRIVIEQPSACKRHRIRMCSGAQAAIARHIDELQRTTGPFTFAALATVSPAPAVTTRSSRFGLRFGPEFSLLFSEHLIEQEDHLQLMPRAAANHSGKITSRAVLWNRNPARPHRVG